MTRHFPIAFFREDSGAYSAYVVGLPIYAQRGTRRGVERAILDALTGFLTQTPDAGIDETRAHEDLRLVAVTAAASRPPVARYVGLGALLGRRTSPRKAAAARRNGRLGGRPRAA